MPCQTLQDPASRDSSHHSISPHHPSTVSIPHSSDQTDPQPAHQPLSSPPSRPQAHQSRHAPAQQQHHPAPHSSTPSPHSLPLQHPHPHPHSPTHPPNSPQPQPPHQMQIALQMGPPPTAGPRLISPARPRSRQTGSRLSFVAFWMPKAACWSGTTSSSSSGFMGMCCACR